MIREFTHRGLPFTIHTTDGKSYDVAHPDFIAIGGEKDETVIVYLQEGGMVMIDVFSIASLEEVKKSA